jgi:hypothetical protein
MSKVHTSPQVARGFPSTVYLWLHNEIVQATSRGHIKSWKHELHELEHDLLRQA